MKIRNWTRKYFEEVPGEGNSGEAGATGGEPASWMAGLPADMQSDPSLKEIKDVEALAKRYVDTKAMVGGSIRVPSEDASAEDMTEFRQKLVDKKLGLVAIPDTDDAEGMKTIYQALGQPEDSKGYVMPEKWNGMTPERFDALANLAHGAGLSKKQFESVTSAIAAEDNAALVLATEQREADTTALKSEWGNAYDQKIARATNIAKQLDAPAGLQEALGKGDANADTLRWLDSIAEKFSGEGNSLVLEEGGVSEHTPTELRERVEELTKKMLAMDVNDTQYQATLKKRMKYLEILNPEKK